MKSNFKLLVIFLLVVQTSFAQNIFDAYRLSFNQINGTARASAMGNAFGALGGDFTSLSVNPAGIGIYRSNELSFTPGMNFTDSKLSLGNSAFSDNKFKLNINNVGFVGTIKTSKSNSGIVSFNWGVGINQLADFNQVSYGENPDSPVSFLDDIVGWANSEGLSFNYLNSDFRNVELRDWPAKLAWDTYLFDPAKDAQNNEIDGQYVAILYQDEKVNQRKAFDISGGINEFLVSAGLNINHKLYLGATFGINDVEIRQVARYTEEFGGNSFMYTDDYALSGSGYNLKLGLIFKPLNAVRIGFAFHTPTYFTLEQSNIYSMESSLLETYYSEGVNSYDYDFYTPFKYVFSGALVLGKKALISLDAEAINYPSMNFRNSEDDFSDLKSEITNEFKSTVNLRAGAEYKFTDQFGLRGGYEMYGNPFKGSYDGYIPVIDKNPSVLAFGLGYTSGGFFMDMAYRMSTTSYHLKEIQPNFDDIDLTNHHNKLLFTLGFKF